jgi:hypothetical protein
MTQELREKLIAKGADALADALLAFAAKSQSIEKALVKLVAVPDLTPLLRKKINALGRWRNGPQSTDVSVAAEEMRNVLEEVRTAVADPVPGAGLMIEFFKADGRVLDSIDDADGTISTVFRSDALALFQHYATFHPDQRQLADAVVELNQNDSKGMRAALIHTASQYLTAVAVDHMSSTMFKAWSAARLALQTRAVNGVSNDKSFQRALPGELLLLSLAKQRRDGKLFECIELASCSKPGTAACLSIASVYLNAGDVAAAKSWLARITDDSYFMQTEIDQLRIDIALAAGDDADRDAAVLRRFRRARSMDAFNAMIAIVGEERYESWMLNERDDILGATEFCIEDAQFLIEIGCLDDAETYLVAHASQLTDEKSDALPAMANTMLKSKRSLPASLLYRASLDSILGQVRTKAYPQGRKYLTSLDQLASTIADWKGAVPHEQYRADLVTKHVKKASFWAL